MNQHTILLGISILVLIVSVYMTYRDEKYATTQYLVEYPNALENQSFGATPLECTKLCKEINKDKRDQINCMDYCNLNSGFIPTLNMIPDGDTLLHYL